MHTYICTDRYAQCNSTMFVWLSGLGARLADGPNSPTRLQPPNSPSACGPQLPAAPAAASNSRGACGHAHTCTPTYRFTHIHTLISHYIYTHTCTHTHPCNACTHSHTHAHMHSHIHTLHNACTQSLTSMHTLVGTSIQICSGAYVLSQCVSNCQSSV